MEIICPLRQRVTSLVQLTTLKIFIATLVNAHLMKNVNVIALLVWAACGGVIQRAQGLVALESYPTNARCEWTVQVEGDSSIELRWVTYFKAAWSERGK